MLEIAVIDAQGGGIGKSAVRLLKQALPDARVVAVGTNALATAAMLKAGADMGATGENSVVYACEHADLLLAPIGITMAGAMYGEITPAMAVAFGVSRARKFLIPAKQSHAYIAGLADKPLTEYVQDAVGAAAQFYRAQEN